MPEAPTARLLDGRALAERMRVSMAPEVERLAAAGRRPRLAVVQVGSHEAAQSYVRGQQRGAERWGIELVVQPVPPEGGERAVRKALRQLNDDATVTGILLALPLPAGMNARALQQVLDPRKDVEGVHPENLGGCLYGRLGLLPCTALACMALVQESGVALRGKDAVVVGHSEIVGKPVALLLLAQDASVSVCHKFTQGLAERTRQADVLVVAVGKAGLVTPAMVKPGAVVVDVGINAVPDASAAGGVRIVGDVDPAVAQVAGALTPVPGGVGPVTVAMLMRNAILAARGVPPPDDAGQLPLFHL